MSGRIRRRARCGSVSVSVDVDVDVTDVLVELDDQTLIEELADRGKTVSTIERDLAMEAYRDLMAGRPNAALAALERALFPSPLADKPKIIGSTPVSRLMSLPGLNA